MLLSIVIPTYNRSQELIHSLRLLREQCQDHPEEIEIIVCDDASTDDTQTGMSTLQAEETFFRYIRYPSNIGLEKNLIECTKQAVGEFLWIFGDDDFLATPNSISSVLEELKLDRYDLLVLNRTRKNISLEKTISKDWMRIKGRENQSYQGLREFFIDWGFLSVVGFVSVNVMRRVPFLNAFDDRYFGTMYPQLGMMADAFSDARILLISEPLVCHRTASAEEKATAFSEKEKEKLFMSDVGRRDAAYFGAPTIRMISLLVEKNSLTFEEINKISENTVIKGRLVDFFFNNIVKAVNYGLDIAASDQEMINKFFSNVDLDAAQINKLSRYKFMTNRKFLPPASNNRKLSISVVTPSFNQAQFFPECLDSVFDQTYSPLEHIVLDPGSTDGSQNIARYYRHVTFICEPDGGQGDAVGKGIELSKGDIIAWLNSDDSYYDDSVFATIASIFNDRTEQVVYGNGVFNDSDGNKIRDVYVNKNPSSLSWRLQQEDGIFQPAVFFRKSVPESIGLPSKYLEYCMDYEYWIRAVKSGIDFYYAPISFAKAYFHTDNKTLGQRGKSYSQVCDMLFDQFGYVNHKWLQRYAEFLSDGLDGVIAHSGNTAIKQKEKCSTVFEDLMEQFNTNASTVKLLSQKSKEKGYGDTLRVLEERKLLATHYVELDEEEARRVPGRVTYSMGGTRWSFDGKWKKKQIARTHDFLREMISTRKSDVCVIVCNGPSLNHIDKSLLSQVDVIACNGIFLDPEVAQHIDFFTCVNYLVAEQYAPKINGLNAFKVIPWWLSYCINESEKTFFVDAKGVPEFSLNIFENMSWRHTVTFFNMHLAYGLGYEKVLLVGCDHSYVQSDTAAEQDVIYDESDDLNHFDPRYFKSKKWQAADTDQMEAMYRLAKEAFDAAGKTLINCTVGGSLELFPRSTLELEIGSHRYPKISAIKSAAQKNTVDRVVIVEPKTRSEAKQQPTLRRVDPLIDQFAVRAAEITGKYPKLHLILAKPWRWYLKKRQWD